MPIDLDPTVVRSWPKLRAYWRQVRGPCARCGGRILYDAPRYRYGWTADGRKVRRENPWALDIGHKLGVDLDTRTAWAPIDTQPEHARCNRAAGAAYGTTKRGMTQRRRKATIALVTSRRW